MIQQVKVILLDTRYHREPYFIPSIGGTEIPFAAVIAAVTRFIVSLTGWASEYPGDVLGEEQWTWLESELRHSDASIHVVVSSIQVLTSNPFVESWGHFPASKVRLIELFRQQQTKGLILLSGDVHFSEISGLDIRPAMLREQALEEAEGVTRSVSHPAESSIVEFTSSGMTHTCTTVW